MPVSASPRKRTMLPAGSPPRLSSNAAIPLRKLVKLSHLSAQYVLIPVVLVPWRIDPPLNSLFHYLPLLGYGVTCCYDFFEALLSGPGAFSQQHGGAFGHDSRFEPLSDP